MKSLFALSPVLVLSLSCSTLDQSFRLGAVTGMIAGAAATHAAHTAAGRTPNPEDVGIAAGIGLGVGLFTAYFLHQAVVEERETTARRTEIYFGDLPPSPFVIPPVPLKGGRQ